MTSIFFFLNTFNDLYLPKQAENLLDKNNVSYKMDYSVFDIENHWSNGSQHCNFFNILINIFNKRKPTQDVGLNDFDFYQKVMNKVNSLPKYDVYCISFFDNYVDLQLLVALRIKQRFPECKVLFGGPEIVLRPQMGRMLKALKFDYSTGDVDVSLLNFITDYSNFYNTRHIGKMNLLTKDDVPKYTQEELVYMNRNILVSSSRGCPHNCYFCSSPKLCSYSFVKRDVLVDWFKYYQDIGVRTCFPSDATFNFGKFDILLDGLIKNNNRIKIQGIDISLRDTRLEDIPKMKEAGINSVAIGLECLHPKLQQTINKKMPAVKDILTILDEYNKNDINVKMFYIAGMPTQTDEIFYEEAEVIKHINDSYDNIEFEYYDYFVSPGSHIANNLTDYNISYDKPYKYFESALQVFKNEISEFKSDWRNPKIDEYMSHLYKITSNDKKVSMKGRSKYE